MVSLSAAELAAKCDLVRRSIDLAVRDLLASETDPFASATYLWIVHCHNLSLVNGDRLTAWGAAWAHCVLAERKVGRRSDEAVASAALAAAAVTKWPAAADAAEIASGLGELLAAELAARAIPFKNPAYAAAVLLGAQSVGADVSQIDETVAAIASLFAESVAHGRALGINSVVRLLQELDASDCLTELRASVRQALANRLGGYEDQLYLIQALVLSYPPAALPADVVDIAGEILVASPIWSFLMVGVEDVEAAGDGRIPVPVSHLYRAALLDVGQRLLAYAATREEAQRDVRYRGRVANALFASLGVAVVLLVPWFLLGWAMIPSLGEARRYWLGSDYSAMAPGAAILFLLGVLALLLLAMLTVVTGWTLWTLLIRSAVESDRRIIEVLRRRVRTAVKCWLVVTPLLIGLVGGPLLHALGDL